DRGRLPARRPVRKTQAPDASVGRLLRQARSGRRDRDTAAQGRRTMKASRRKPRVAVVGAVGFDFKLTDEQWNEIANESAKLGSISPSKADEVQARPRMEAIIGILRSRKQGRSASISPAEARKELMAISTIAWDLQERLRSLEQSHLLVRHSFSYPKSHPEVMVLSFTKEKGNLRLLEVRANLVAGDIGRGVKDRDAYFLVQVLDDILRECTGRGISRSNKRTNSTREYVKTVCRIADPDMGDGTIERAMKECIKHRP